MLHAIDIKQAAQAEGFSACGIARAERVSAEREAERHEWIEKGQHGDMDYLARNLDKRLDPRLLVEGARSIVSVAVNYNPYDPNKKEAFSNKKEAFSNKKEVFSNKKEAFSNKKGTYPHDNNASFCSDDNEFCDENANYCNFNAPNELKLARYAYGTDYHEVVKQMLGNLMLRLGLKEYEDGRCFVDTAPIDEKYWAEQAGLGWRGRNSQLIIPGMGSYFVLGELVLLNDVDVYDETAKNRCGNCHACLSACPMNALNGKGTLDARRCLSYLTIEHRGDLPDEAKNKLGNCFYGCDRCAEVCPWNRQFAQATTITELQPRPDILAMTPNDWQHLTLEKYQALFKKSAVKRAKFEGITRNIEAVFLNKKQ